MIHPALTFFQQTFLNVFRIHVLWRQDYPISLTLFKMERGAKGPPPPSHPTTFSPVTSTNVGIRPKNFLTSSFNPFDRLV